MEEIQDWTTISFEEAKSALKKWREEHARRSEEVVEIWEYVLSRYSGSLKDELWVVLEQVAVAAIDQARFDLAIHCIQILTREFPQSSRVTKLQAMRLEAIGDWENAEHLYDRLIEKDEANSTYRKRKIAILLAKGERQEAIRELNQFLSVFINDTEAWLELSQLFILEVDFTRAAFCFEEVLLTHPLNSTYLAKIADIRYSQGGLENVELARRYYEKSILLVPSIQALYGIILCYNQLMCSNIAGKKEMIMAAVRTCDQLSALYKSKSTMFNHTGDDNGNCLNPTINRQLKVIQRLRAVFKE